jgi:hypothetical protein
MKKILASLFVLLLSVSIFAQGATTAQTTTVERVYGVVAGNNVLTAVKVHVAIALDSANTNSITSDAIKIPEYLGVNPVNYPVQFRWKGVGTHGVPNTFITVQALLDPYSGSTLDTASVDTIRQHAVAQTEGDTVGVLTFESGGLLASEDGFKVYFRNITADVHAGRLTLIFPIPIEAYVTKKGYPR